MEWEPRGLAELADEIRREACCFKLDRPIALSPLLSPFPNRTCCPCRGVRPPQRGSIMPCCARRPGWVGVAGSAPAHHPIGEVHTRSWGAPPVSMLGELLHPQRDRGGPALCLWQRRDLTTKCVVQRCDKSPTEPKHVCRVSSLTRVSARGPTHG
jgi:hypothetical protein